MKEPAGLGSIILINLLLPVLVGCLASSPAPIEIELPPHKVSYVPEITITVEGEKQHWSGLSHPDFYKDFPIIILKEIGKVDYPHLTLREGFALYLVRNPAFGASDIYLLALHEASEKGFVVERLNDVHGEFLFAPIENADTALEYTKLMFSEAIQDAYSRDITFIHSLDDLNSAIGDMREHAKRQSPPEEVRVLTTPPTKVSKATEHERSKYLIELVYWQEYFKQTIDYHAFWVQSDGSIKEKEHYSFIEGSFLLIIIE